MSALGWLGIGLGLAVCGWLATGGAGKRGPGVGVGGMRGGVGRKGGERSTGPQASPSDTLCGPHLPAWLAACRDVLHKCLEHSAVNVQEALANNPDAYPDESERSCSAVQCCAAVQSRAEQGSELQFTTAGLCCPALPGQLLPAPSPRHG